MRSLTYLGVSLRKTLLGQGGACPSCGCDEGNAVVDRKWVITTLRRCGRCRLLFRVPTTSEKENERIYQAQYRQGSTTDLPDSETLQRLKSENFLGSSNDYSNYIAVLRTLQVRAGARVYDFGCSWGYGAFQLSAAGFEVEGYEISEPRARFAAEKLGVRLRAPDAVPESFYDVFFSAHVIEHVPSVRALLSQAEHMLRPGGWFVAFTPNGSQERQRRDFAGWHQQWGFVHPQLLDREWVEGLGRKNFVLADTTPYDLATLAAGRSPAKFDGSELLLIIRKPGGT